jgi:hypothetical protein
MQFIVAVDGAVLALLAFLAHWESWIFWTFVAIAVISGAMALKIYLSCKTHPESKNPP